MKKKNGKKKKFVDYDVLMKQNQFDFNVVEKIDEDSIKHQVDDKKDNEQIKEILVKKDNITTQVSTILIQTTTNHSKKKGKCKKKDMCEITNLYDIRKEDDDPFLDDPTFKAIKDNSDQFRLRPTKKQGQYEYQSTFEVGKQVKIDSPDTELTDETDQLPINSDNILDQFMMDYYIKVLHESFPSIDKIDIANKLCEFGFDMDRLVLFYFDNSTLTNIEYSQYENMVISNIESLAKDFSEEFNNKQITTEILASDNLQGDIENNVKKQYLLDLNNNNEYNEIDYPYVSPEVKKIHVESKKVSDEYFLEKPIEDIESPEIKEDLLKLCTAFPYESQFRIKWVYYQFMDLHDSIKHLEQYNFNHSANLRNLFNKQQKTVIVTKVPSTGEKDKFYAINNDDTNDEPYNETYSMNVMEILHKKPTSWNISKTADSCININEYQSIRSQLIKQATLAWKCGRGKDAKAIMAKARRYKLIIDEAIKKHKVKTFMKNNQQFAIENMYSKQESTIDLHGLSLEESIIILKHKLFEENESDPSNKRILIIITGKGLHSQNNEAVLFPKLSRWLKDRGTIKTEPDYAKGIITIYY